eukprot:12345827-Heterocapsa_arctica.AAC.1
MIADAKQHRPHGQSVSSKDGGCAPPWVAIHRANDPMNISTCPLVRPPTPPVRISSTCRSDRPSRLVALGPPPSPW